MSWIQSLDEQLLRWVAELRTPALNAFMMAYTSLGTQEYFLL